jgi:glycosyltransferase involved in cell wall biosynthesis
VQSLGQDAPVALIKQCDIQALFSVCDLVVCQRSNVIVEAAVRGVPCIACNFTGDETIVIDFVAEGLCVGAESPEEFARIAADALAGGKMWDEMKRRLATVSRFNGPNDGRSAERIADRVLSLRETAS